MKKWIVLLLLVAIGAGGYVFYGKYKRGSDIAKEHEERDLAPEEIREGLRSEDITLRLAAVNQLDKLPEATRKAALLEALQGSTAPTRLTAVTALAERFPKDTQVIEGFLATARDDPDDDVASAAFEALRKSGDPRALTLSVEVLNSMEAGLAARLTAARTLDRLTGRTTSSDLSGQVDSAEATADDLGMEWEEWLSGRLGKLGWDEESGRFVEGE